EIENDQFIIAGVGPFSLGTVQTFRKFDRSGNKLGTITLPLPGYQHNWIVDVTVGPDNIIYSLAHATPNGGAGMDWFINALGVDGELISQWSLNTGDDTFDFPESLAALGHGRLIACGWVDDYDAHLVSLQALLTSAPDVATVVAGQRVSGDVHSLAAFDG